MTRPRETTVNTSWVSALAEALSVPVVPTQTPDGIPDHPAPPVIAPESRWLEEQPSAARPAVTAAVVES